MLIAAAARPLDTVIGQAVPTSPCAHGVPSPASPGLGSGVGILSRSAGEGDEAPTGPRAARPEDRLRAWWVRGSGLRDRVFREDRLGPLEGFVDRLLGRHAVGHDIEHRDAEDMLGIDLRHGRVVRLVK
jgi:hypothetical protein